MKFDRLGVFTYSKEEGTPAYKMKNQIKKHIKLSRQKQLLALQNEVSTKKNLLRLGNTYKAIVEGIADDGIFYYGRTQFEAPEIDGIIYFTSPDPLDIGTYVDVKILNAEDYDLIGEVTNEFAQ